LISLAGVRALQLRLPLLNHPHLLLQLIPLAGEGLHLELEILHGRLEIIPLESGVWWDLGLESRGDAWKDLQLYIARYGDSPDPSQMYQWYVSGQVGIWNWERWKNPDFDELFDKGLGETDAAAREAIYQRMAEILDDTAAYVYITHEPIPHLYRANLNPVIHLDATYDIPRFTRA